MTKKWTVENPWEKVVKEALRAVAPADLIVSLHSKGPELKMRVSFGAVRELRYPFGAQRPEPEETKRWAARELEALLTATAEAVENWRLAVRLRLIKLAPEKEEVAECSPTSSTSTPLRTT